MVAIVGFCLNRSYQFFTVNTTRLSMLFGLIGRLAIERKSSHTVECGAHSEERQLGSTAHTQTSRRRLHNQEGSLRFAGFAIRSRCGRIT